MYVLVFAIRVSSTPIVGMNVKKQETTWSCSILESLFQTIAHFFYCTPNDGAQKIPLQCSWDHQWITIFYDCIFFSVAVDIKLGLIKWAILAQQLSEEIKAHCQTKQTIWILILGRKKKKISSHIFILILHIFAHFTNVSSKSGAVATFKRRKLFFCLLCSFICLYWKPTLLRLRCCHRRGGRDIRALCDVIVTSIAMLLIVSPLICTTRDLEAFGTQKLRITVRKIYWTKRDWL